jgi:hypothetical protein
LGAELVEFSNESVPVVESDDRERMLRGFSIDQNDPEEARECVLCLRVSRLRISSQRQASRLCTQQCQQENKNKDCSEKCKEEWERTGTQFKREVEMHQIFKNEGDGYIREQSKQQ